jgi:hypothetical protein
VMPPRLVPEQRTPSIMQRCARLVQQHFNSSLDRPSTTPAMHATLAYAYPNGPKRSATSLGVPQAGPSTPVLRSAPPVTGSSSALPMTTTNRLGRIDPIIKRKVQPSAPDTQ